MKEMNKYANHDALRSDASYKCYPKSENTWGSYWIEVPVHGYTSTR